MAQSYGHLDKMFLEVPLFYLSVCKSKKNTLATSLLLMLQQFEMIYLMMFILPLVLACYSKKLKSYHFKKVSPP